MFKKALLIASVVVLVVVVGAATASAGEDAFALARSGRHYRTVMRL